MNSSVTTKQQERGVIPRTLNSTSRRGGGGENVQKGEDWDKHKLILRVRNSKKEEEEKKKGKQAGVKHKFFFGT